MPTNDHDKSPISLFLEIWNDVLQLSGFQRLTATLPGRNFTKAVDIALTENDGNKAYERLREVVNLGLQGNVRAEQNGVLISVLQRIDNIFLEIHPRTQHVSPSVGIRKFRPAWLRDANSRRFVFGSYFMNERYRLVPRGPLVRLPREEFSANAETMDDMFCALAVVRNEYSIAKRKINIEHLVISSSSINGIVPGSACGNEAILFVPVAESGPDLSINAKKVASQDFADFRLSAGLNASDIMLDAIRNADAVDIAIAPELVVSEVHSLAFERELRRAPLLNARMIVAGSGHTLALSKDGNSWNEARVLNGRGYELWRQRKVWPAALKTERATDYGIAHTCKHVVEDNAEGNTVVIADVDGLGRCAVLICQDIEARPLADDLVREFQPDWIFVPILDAGIEPGRWIHQRTFELSANSNARYVVVSSTSLARLHSTVVPALCGIAVGPKSASDDGSDKGRQFASAEVPVGAKFRFAKIVWRSGKWEQSTLNI